MNCVKAIVLALLLAVPTAAQTVVVTGFLLVDADTDRIIGPLEDGSVINLQDVPNRDLSIVFEVQDYIQDSDTVYLSMAIENRSLNLPGAVYIDRTVPYSLCQDTPAPPGSAEANRADPLERHNYFRCLLLRHDGEVTVTVMPRDRDFRGSHTWGSRRSITFSITGEKPPAVIVNHNGQSVECRGPNCAEFESNVAWRDAIMAAACPSDSSGSGRTVRIGGTTEIICP